MSRDIKLLYPPLQYKCIHLVDECKRRGYKIGISETFRTVAEQNDLYAKGRTKPGSIVTNCKGTSYSSMHQWGVAFDFYRNDGKGAYYDKDGFFDAVGKIGQELGLEWGGSWKSFVDKPHFQLPDWGSTSTKLKAIYGTPDNFKKTWISGNTKPEKKVDPTPSTKPSNMQIYKVSAKSGLNVRTGPGTNYKVIKALPYNSGFIGDLDSVKNGFINGFFDGSRSSGWVSQKWLKKV